MHKHAGDTNRPNRLKSAIPIQRIGTVDDIAQTVMWLLSDESSYITGTTVDVSGGR